MGGEWSFKGAIKEKRMIVGILVWFLILQGMVSVFLH
jgi:hypothetical protein